MTARLFFIIVPFLLLKGAYSQNILEKELKISSTADSLHYYLKKAKKLLINEQVDLAGNYLKKGLKIVQDQHLLTDNAVEIYYLFGKLYYMKNRPDSALLFAKKSIEATRKSNSNNLLAKSYYLLANIKYNRGNYFEANRIFAKALAYARKIKDSVLMTDILIDKAYSHVVVAEQDSVLQLLEKAVDISRKINYTKGTGKAEIGLGNMYFRIEDFKNALTHYQAALEVAKKIKNHLGTGISYKNIADVYLSEGKYDKAIAYLQLALDELNKLKSPVHTSNVYNDFALIYAQKNQTVKMSYFLDKSIKTAKHYGTDEDLAIAYNVGGNAYHYLKKYRLSNIYLDSCIRIARRINFGLMLQKAYKLYSENLYALNDFKKAFDYYKNYNKIKDSIASKESRDKMAQFQAKYDNLLKQMAIERLKNRERINKANNRILWISLIAVAVIFLLIVYKIQTQRKKEMEIRQQKLIIKQKEEEILKNKLKKAGLEEQQLKQELDFKTKQLTTHALNMMQKNRLLQDLSQMINEKSENLSGDSKKVLKQIKENLEQTLKSDEDWELFKTYFEQIDKQFFSKLKKINPQLKTKDYKLSALIKLNLSLKETANVLGTTLYSVKNARYRLKKKLHLKPEQDLKKFLDDL